MLIKELSQSVLQLRRTEQRVPFFMQKFTLKAGGERVNVNGKAKTFC